MLVVLDASLFNPQAKVEVLDLLGLFVAARDERHCLICDPPFEAAASETVNAWLAGRDERTAKAVTTVLDQGNDVWPSLPAGQVTIRATASSTDWARGHVAVPSALDLLEEPLRILLEHHSNDLAFLRRLAPAPHRRQLDRALERGWAVAEHGGGLGTMKIRVEELLTSPADDERARRERLRTWVLFDRDAADTDRRAPSPYSERLRERLEETVDDDPWPIGYQRLEQRSIENYLPEAALRSWQRTRGRERTRRRQAVDALCTLRRDQPESRRRNAMG